MFIFFPKNKQQVPDLCMPFRALLCRIFPPLWEREEACVLISFFGNFFFKKCYINRVNFFSSTFLNVCNLHQCLLIAARWPFPVVRRGRAVNEKNLENQKRPRQLRGFPTRSSRDYFFRFSCFFQSGWKHSTGRSFFCTFLDKQKSTWKYS